MRILWFCAAAVALVAAGVGRVDLQAGCRCHKVARQQARAERKQARRGVSFLVPAQPSQVSPYPNQVQSVGAKEAPDGFYWDCNGRRCRLVRSGPTAALKPVPDPNFKAVTQPTREAANPSPPVKRQAETNPADRETILGEAETFGFASDPPVAP